MGVTAAVVAWVVAREGEVLRVVAASESRQECVLVGGTQALLRSATEELQSESLNKANTENRLEKINTEN
jgi:hypothetical protein